MLILVNHVHAKDIESHEGDSVPSDVTIASPNYCQGPISMDFPYILLRLELRFIARA